MPQYLFSGKARFRGVDFYINADTLEAAIERAKAGKSDGVDIDAAEMYDCEIDISSGGVND